MTTEWSKLRERLDKVQPATATFRMCPDTEVRLTYLQAKAAVETAKDRADEAREAFAAFAAVTDDASEAKRSAERRSAAAEQELKDAQAALRKASKAYEDVVIPLTFRAIGREAVDALLKEHPPTEEEEAKGAEWHFDTFAPALIAAASVDGMPAEDAARYLSEWTDPDATALWTTAWGVQQVRRTDVGKG